MLLKIAAGGGGAALVLAVAGGSAVLVLAVAGGSAILLLCSPSSGNSDAKSSFFSLPTEGCFCAQTPVAMHAANL